MVEFRGEVVRQVGLGYIVQACLALLLPCAAMASGLCAGRKGAEGGASANGGAATPSSNSGAGDGAGLVS